MVDISVKINNSLITDIESVKIKEFQDIRPFFPSSDLISFVDSYQVEIKKQIYTKEIVEIDIKVKNNELAFIIDKNFINEFFNFDFRAKYISHLFIFKKRIDNDNELLTFKNDSKYTKPTNKDIVELIVFKVVLKMPKQENEVTFGLKYISNLDILSEPKLHPLKEAKDKVNPEKKIAVIVHGLGGTVGNNYFGLYDYLKEDFNTFSFNYPSVTEHIETNGKTLADELNILKDMFSQDVYIFSHSMGGLVARSALVKESAPIKNIVMAGTPNGGVRYTALHRARGLFYFIRNKINFVPKEILATKYQDASGLRDLHYNSKFLTSLNDGDNKDNCYNRYFSLAGDFAFGHSDIVVSVNKICRININNTKYAFKSVVNNWHHYNYYNKLDKTLSDSLDTARYCLNF